MLKLFNYINDPSLFDHNLLTNTLVIGSITLIGCSLYFFSGYLTKTTVDSGTENTSSVLNTPSVLSTKNIDNDSLTSVNTLDKTSSSTIVTETSDLTAEQETITDGTNLEDRPVLTEQEILFDFLKDFL
jgi:hypothetical protein